MQVSGVDSQVKAIIKNAYQQLLPKEELEKNSLLNNMVNGLSLILVVDGRGIPEENKEILNNFQHLVYLKNCKNLEPSDLLPRSSTMQRFLHSDIYYPDEEMDRIFEKFDYNWLIDTGISLGKGRQGTGQKIKKSAGQKTREIN